MNQLDNHETELERLKELHTKITELKRQNLREVEIDQIKEEIGALMPKGESRSIRTAEFKPGSIFYRIIKYDEPPKNVRGLSYPPPDFVMKDGRLNRAGTSVFYCSDHQFAPHIEADLRIGDRFVLSKWKSCLPFYAVPVGYTHATFLQMDSDRIPSHYINLESNHLEVLYNEFLASEMTRIVAPSDEHEYKLSIAIAEANFSSIMLVGNEKELPCVMYPTIPASGISDNLAIKTSFVDKGLKLAEVTFSEVSNAGPSRFDIQEHNYADSVDDDGEIMWHWPNR